MTGSTRSLAALAATCLIAGPAAAKMRPEAQKLYDAGKRDLEAGRFDAAAFNFRRSLTFLDPGTEDGWQLLVALALAAEKAGRPVDALEYFRDFVRHSAAQQESLSDKWRTRRTNAEQASARLEREILRTHGRVDLETDPPGAAIKVDGLPIGADLAARTPYTAYLAAGSHRVGLLVEGHPAQERTVEITAGASQSVRVTLQAPPKPSVEAEVRRVEVPIGGPDLIAPPAGEVSATSEPGPPILGWAGLGVGAACLVVGGVFLGLAAGDVAESHALERDDPEGPKKYAELEDLLQRDQAIGWVFLGVGAAVAAGSAIYLAVDALQDPAQDAQVLLVPGRDGVSGVFRTRF